MTHYVLLKFTEGADLDAIEAYIRSVYDSLAAELDYLKDPVVYRCCVDRASNADIMAVMTLDSEDCLEPYLTHPGHVRMAETLKDKTVSRISFDHH